MINCLETSEKHNEFSDPKALSQLQFKIFLPDLISFKIIGIKSFEDIISLKSFIYFSYLLSVIPLNLFFLMELTMSRHDISLSMISF